MQNSNSLILSLGKKIALLVGLYSLSRLIFYLFYLSHFNDISIPNLFWIFIVGIRFDLSAIILLNALFILLFLIPLSISHNKYYQITLKWLFIIVNSLGLLANCIDFAYFGFTLKRTTADVFNFFGGTIGNDLGHLIPLFFIDYWYVFLIWLALSFVLYKAYKYSKNNTNYGFKIGTVTSWATYVLTILLCVLLYRGGFQLKPITIVDAGEYTNSKNIPLLLNTPFTILKTIDIKSIEPAIYYANEAEMKFLYNPFRKGSGNQMQKKNVFLIILESFSKEFVGSINGRGKGFTPFLDSLMSQSYVCSNAYSNGKKSIEGIPAITASIPTWMDEDYITSAYGGNEIKGLAQLLKDEGYYTAFFHGGTNGTMGFEAFSKVAGYKDYFGKNEYKNDRDYDGNWGIWDEPFLQFTAKTINEKQSPFFATVFTLSSHHPFIVPEKYKDKFKGGAEPIFKTIQYTDFALKQFFETVKKMPWYSNTLFVFCADHTGPSHDPYFDTKVGSNAIPIFYFQPDSFLKNKNSNLTQQIDIMPSILDYLNYNKPYFSFGKSIFDTTSYQALSYNSGLYQFMEGNYVIQFDGTKTNEMYNYQTDSLLKQNLINTEKEILNKMESKTKAIIQTYQQSLINNRMVVK